MEYDRVIIMIKKIAVITGTRADYGYLKPLIMRIHEDDELELQLYVTGMHLVKEHGHTLDEVKKDFPVKEVVLNLDQVSIKIIFLPKILKNKEKKILKEINIDTKKEIEANKDMMQMAKMALGFTNAKLFDFFLNAVEKSEKITVVAYVYEDKFEDVLKKIE